MTSKKEVLPKKLRSQWYPLKYDTCFKIGGEELKKYTEQETKNKCKYFDIWNTEEPPGGEEVAEGAIISVRDFPGGLQLICVTPQQDSNTSYLLDEKMVAPLRFFPRYDLQKIEDNKEEISYLFENISKCRKIIIEEEAKIRAYKRYIKEIKETK